MVDAPRLRALLQRIEDRRKKLGRYAAMSVEEYLGSPERVDASKYLLLTAIDDAIAAANHVIASQNYRTPGDYADAFRSLAEAGVLDRPQAERLQSMARFRNLLVYVYSEVDDRRVHEFLRSELEDLDAFVRALVEAFPQED
jgi:uncharacterized protein YutE (UPF0331/DUF86 family)